MESCRRIGYDVQTWVDEGLCDIMIAGGGAVTDPGIEVEAFLKLVGRTPIRFYTGFDSGLWGERKGLKSQQEWHRAWVRGTAKGYWDRGSHGMYVFNWHANERTRRDLLTRIGSAQTLERTDKVFAVVHRHITETNGPWARADLNDRIFGETPVVLYRTLTDEGPMFHVSVYDKVAREATTNHLKSVELRVELDQFSLTDQVQVELDGERLDKPTVRSVAQEDVDDPSDVGESSWLVWSLNPEQADCGSHEVQIRLFKRNPHIKPPLVVRHVEIHVNYT